MNNDHLIKRLQNSRNYPSIIVTNEKKIIPAYINNVVENRINYASIDDMAVHIKKGNDKLLYEFSDEINVENVFSFFDASEFEELYERIKEIIAINNGI